MEGTEEEKEMGGRGEEIDGKGKVEQKRIEDGKRRYNNSLCIIVLYNI